MPRQIPSFLLSFLLLLSPSFCHAAGAETSQTSVPPAQVSAPRHEAPRYKVEVDFSKRIGDATQITDFFGAGGSIYYIGSNVDDPIVQSWRDLDFKQISFETLHMEEPADRWIQVKIDEKGAVQVDFSDYDRYMRTYLNNLGAKPFVYLGNIPRALSSKPDDPNYAVYTPKNLKLWQDFVKKIVRHNVDKFKLKGINYGVLGEPDHPNSWRGSGSGDPKKTLREHIELYAATYRAVKAADKTARVGGPSFMSWKETEYSEKPAFVLKDWIKALAQYNAEDPDQAVGLDYISWQDYGWNGGRISDGADAVSGYLKQNGFDPQTPKMLAGSGWGSWSSNYLDEKQSPWQRASFVAANIIQEFKNPDQRKFHEAIYYSFYFNDYWMTPETEKDMAFQRATAMVIIPKEGRFQLTPIYASFQMAKAMASGHIAQSSSDKALEAMATVHEAAQKAFITVNNNSPELVIAEFSVKNFPLDLKVVKAKLQSIDEFHSIDGHGLEEGFEISPHMNGQDGEIAIFVKPYGTLQLSWGIPPPPKEEEVPKEEQQADDDVRPEASPAPGAG